ncbi:MAG: AAA family ATPase [Hyphomicrobiales bacterium]|nr:AAA family ATPase [Hyphomicrobiales bacterium]
MIIELFGPPGVGKTTFAKCLAKRLREHGHAAELTMSVRPAEKSIGPSDGPQPEGGRRRAAFERLGRPLLAMLKRSARPRDGSKKASPATGSATRLAIDAASHSATGAATDTARDLMRMLRPKSLLWSFRLEQYLTRLSSSWRDASESERITIFDQAFVQAISSLMLLGENEDETLVCRLLDRAPKADLIIRLDAPRDVLEARLRTRNGAQGMLERLFELDLDRNLELMGITDRLQALLERRGERIIRVRSLDRRSLEGGVSQIEELIAHRTEARPLSRVAS